MATIVELSFRFDPYSAHQSPGGTHRKLAEGGLTLEDGQDDQIHDLRETSSRWEITAQAVPFCIDCPYQTIYSCGRMKVESRHFIEGATRTQLVQGNAYCSEASCSQAMDLNGETLPLGAPCRSLEGVSNVRLQVTPV